MSAQSNATPFSDLKTMILEIFKRTDKATELARAINDTYREMAGCIDPRKLKDQIWKATIAGREEYPIPDTVLRINHPIRLIDPDAGSGAGSSYPLQFIPKDEYDLVEPNPNSADVQTGTPYAYTFWKNSILLTDVPNKIFRLELNIGGEPTILTEAADTTIFAPQWDETIKAGALARLFAGIRFWDEVDRWQAIYRYGFAGDRGNIVGGLELLKQLEAQIATAPLIVKPNDF